MEANKINQIVDNQRKFFLSGGTLPVDVRIDVLKKLREVIIANEVAIEDAIHADLMKSSFESYMCEVGMALDELKYMIKHTRSLAREKHIPSPLAQFASRSYKKPSPYGVTLVMSPWNYPFLLSVDPIIDAIAAGNTVILKPSAYSPNTSALLARLLTENFDEKHIAVVTGGREENEALLSAHFDYIFFTGSKAVGKKVMESASRYLTPVTLELGGKSPCIVLADADIKLAAKRIVFGKYLNCGQTCVAPDYVLCHSSVKERFIEEVKRQIALQYGEKPLENTDYGKIINQKHFERICGLIDKDKVVYGGNIDADALRIEPTVLDNVTDEDAVMGQEIFGPIMPIMTFENTSEVVSYINSKDHPLALYVFTSSTKNANMIIASCGFGGGCINDTIIHLATHEMGFGGFGESGMGSYHGAEGFATFSHYKSIVDKKTFIDLPMRYAPYSKTNEKLVRFFLK